MRVRDLILVNWGLIPDGTYSLPELTAITGDTGSGKTSIIDALIAVMTGAHSRIGKFNTASDDGRGERHRNATYRTLASYVLGAQDDLFARNTAHGYCALVFEPEETEEAKPFSAVVGASAIVSHSQAGEGEGHRAALLEALHLIIVAGERVRKEDFVVPRADGKKECVPVAGITDVLRDLYASRKKDSRVKVHDLRDEHRDYMKRLYGLLRGREEVSAEEAENAASAFSRFVSQEHIEKISDFVRKFVLPEPESFEELDRISDGIRKSRKLRDHAKALSDRLKSLDEAVEHGHRFTSAVIHAQVMSEAAARREVDEAVAAGRRADLAKREKERSVEEATKALGRMDASYNLAQDRNVDVLARLRGIPAFQQEASLREQDGKLRLIAAGAVERAKGRGRAMANLARLIQVLQLAAGQCDDFPGLMKVLQSAVALTLPKPTEFDELAAACADVPSDGLSKSAWEILAHRAASVERPLFNLGGVLCGEERPLRAEVAAAVAALNQNIVAVKADLEEKQKDASLIEQSDRIRLPREVDAVVRYIESEIPESKPEVLCNLITDVRDDSWQQAIEGHMGGARFRIVVAPNTEKQVNRLLEAAKLPMSSVLQGRLAMEDAKTARVEQNSIIHELVVENPYVKAYLAAQYGRTLKIETTDQLVMARKGLTKTGRGSGGYATHNHLASDNDLTFGKRARQRRREARLAEIRGLQETQTALEGQLRDIRSLNEIERELDKLGREGIEALALEAIATIAAIGETHRALEALDTSDAKELKAELVRIQAELAEIDKKRGDEREKRAAATNEIDRLVKAIAREAERSDQAEIRRMQAEKDLNALARHAPWVDVGKMREEANAMVEDLAVSEDEIQEKRRKSLSSVREIRGQFVSAVSAHNRLAVPEEAFDAAKIFDDEAESTAAFITMSDLVVKLQSLASTIRHNKLANSYAEMVQIERVIREAFSTQFCGRIAKEINDATRVLDTLNRELSGHRFGADVFKFHSEWSSPEHKRRFEFFGLVMKRSLEEGFDMFAPEALELEQARLRDEMLGLFLAADNESRARLSQIADYRTYRVYDLLKVVQSADGSKPNEISLTKQATGSGGEKETGLFVARVATITAAFRLREPGAHLRAVVIDELFKKTGEGRIRQAIEYLSRTLGLQVIFAMPTRSFGPFKDLVDGEHNLARVPSATPIGEVSHFIVAEYHAYKPAAIAELRERKRVEVRRQATIDFEVREAAEQPI